MSRFNYSKNSSFDHESDVSEADQNDIAKILQDTDDLDGDIFKGKKSVNLSKTMPVPQKPPVSSLQRNKSFAFDDDPMDDLDSLIGKKQQNTSNKPPLATTMPTPNLNYSKPNKIGFLDDQDDFDLKPKGNQAKTKSLVDDLFGKSKEDKPTDKANLNSNQRVDDDFSFGGYVPSASAGRPATQAKRNVSFNGGDLFNDDLFSSRPKTTESSNLSRNNSNATSSLMKTMPASTSSSKKPYDDFDFDFDSLVKPKNQTNQQRPATSANTTQQKPSSESDWFGGKDTSKLDTSQELIGLDNSFSNKRRPSLNDSKFLSDKPPIASRLEQVKQANKDSMNSSFADSIENAEPVKPGQSGFNINNINPLNFEFGQSKHPQNKEQDSMVPSDSNEDGWLSNLINKKGTANNNSNTNNNKKSNNSSMDLFDSKLDRPTLNNNISSTNNNQFLHDRSSTPGHLEQTSSSKNVSNQHKFKPIVVENVNYDANEVQNLIQKLKQLEYENQDLNMQLQHNKAHYELQIQLIQDSCENRIRMMKEDRENSIKHFKDEKEILQNHIDMIEKEKNEMTSSYKRKLDERQKEFDLELEKLRQLQKDAIENLKVEHEEAMKRVKFLKETELNAAIAASAHTRTIESVINLIEDNTKNLDNITNKVQMGHMNNLNEHEVQLRNKEEQLRLQEQRLAKQQKEYENEIRLLNETIQRLENHLAEQSKAVAEERWKGKQHEKKMEAFQEALINEQRIMMEKLARERNDIERSKDEILVEQKRLMQQIYEEKRKIAEERANLEAAMNAYKDKQHKDSLNNINIEAEISVSSKRLNDDKIRMEKLKDELKEKEMELKQEKLRIEEKKQELDTKAAKLEQWSVAANQKFKEAEDLYMKANREKESNTRVFEQAHNIKQNHDQRINQLQQQLMVLTEREAQINQEKIELYKQRQELEAFKSTIMCTKCKDPVKDFGLLGVTTQSSGYGTGFFSYQPALKYQPSLLAQVNNYDLEDAKLMRQLKIQALKDKQFINEEKQFIDALRSNSFMSKSFSMNQLNSTFA